MKPEQWGKVESIFHKALDADESRRSSVIEELCAGDEALRREVESLLAHHSDSASFIEQPAFADQVDTIPFRPVTAAAVPRPDLKGVAVGHYRILEEIGTGGMGVVYKAEDTRLGRLVALKFLPEHMAADSVALERFRREARSASSLNHPNICTIHDIDVYEGREFIVMEYLDGQTLAMYMAGRRAVGAELVAKLGMPIAEALGAAHSKGVIHRDIKPANIFVTQSGLVKVLDFGVAKLVAKANQSEATTLTDTHAIIGTPLYMSPEQLRGENLDPRADIYAFGVVLYEIAAGQRPYSSSLHAQLVDEILNRSASPPSSINKKLSAKADDIILKCLAKDPEDRYQTAKEIAVDLRHLSKQSTSGSVSADTSSVRAGSMFSPRRPSEFSRKQAANQLIEHQFMLTERVCRKLDRATLDPRIIGDHLRYVDNQVDSDVLVFFLHGLGLDHGDFEPILKNLAYRGLSPTLYGCEPDRRRRISLSLADHVAILREWLREISGQFQPEIVVMVGFSLGADMGFEMLLGPAGEPAPRIDAFLSLECNLSLDTCFASRVLAGISPDRPEVSIADLKRMGDSATSLEDWLNMQDYLVKVLRKFQGDIGVLRRAATDIVRPFSETPGFEVFARRFKGARERLPTLRLVISNDSSYRAALADLKLQNLDNGILGEEFPEDMITVSGSQDHFGLMAAHDVLRQVDEVVAETRKRRNLSGKPG